MTVAILALAVRRSYYSARSHPHYVDLFLDLNCDKQQIPKCGDLRLPYRILQKQRLKEQFDWLFKRSPVISKELR
jgi:hypothetical protein